ncbi:DUF411 domain-containing protein [Novispirillum itersonii]|uniref:CopG protein n=1 Tax=Novispirillum itersonii TaxID=189 RepID=A0A7X0DN87_NOVIT|nr:DUF411 domain-containing protein [Novispirillum itersonii]MBB6211099.1 hypothetical protein [Novispirillum itersonii]
MRRHMMMALVAAGVLMPVAPAMAGEMTLYKNPQCGCCEGHAAYLEQQGYRVKVVTTDALARVKTMAGVPPQLESCHTIMVDGYVVEGHVPVSAIKKLLTEKPAVRGIALAGMPQGSPGMSGEKDGPFVVESFGGGQTAVFAVE